MTARPYLYAAIGEGGYDVTAVRSFASRRGKQSELGEWSAGQATLVLADTDGNLDPLLPGSTGSSWRPGTPVSVILVDVDDTATTVFRGYLSETPSPSSDPISHDLLVTMQLTDLIGWAAGYGMPDCEWSALVAGKSPDRGMWIPGDAQYSAGSDAFFAARYVSGHPMGLTFGSGDFSFTTDDPNVPGSRAPSIVIAPNRMAKGTPYFSGTDGSTGYTVALWMQAESGAVTTQTVLAQGLDSGGNVAFILRMEGTGQVTFIWVNSDGTSTAAQTAAGIRHDDGKPHLLIAWLDQTGRKVWLVTDLDTASSGSVAIFKVTRSVATVQLGSTSTTQSTVRVSHLLVQGAGAWFGAADATLAALVQKLAAGTPIVWDQDTPTQRANHILASVPGVPAPTSIIAQTQNGAYYTGEPGFGPYSQPSNVGDALQSLGPALLGSAYMTAGGSFYMRTAVALTNAAYADRLATPIGELSDDPDATGVVRYSGRSRTGQRVDRVVNKISLSTAFAGFPTTTIALDEASIAAYGERAETIDNAASFPGDSLVIKARVDRFKDPSVEIGDVVVEPMHDPAAVDLVRAAELERVVTYTETPPYSTTPIYDRAAMRIIRIDWDWQNGIDWKVTLGLEPA